MPAAQPSIGSTPCQATGRDWLGARSPSGRTRSRLKRGWSKSRSQRQGRGQRQYRVPANRRERRGVAGRLAMSRPIASSQSTCWTVAVLTALSCRPPQSTGLTAEECISDLLLCTKVNPGGNVREKGFALCVKVATPSQGISKAPPRGGAIAPCRPALTLTLIFQTANRHPQVGRSYLPGGFANPAPADQMHVTSMESCGPMSISTIPEPLSR